ncbi:MAG TPA: hypothetical protein VFK54_03070 [Candidatus Limnocylindrales bacterium]|nr:hypothetical protein [Candidatus Limnocylindrales bacterium]
MSPPLLLATIVAALIALIPVWRLHRAGWSQRSLTIIWLALSGALLIVLTAPSVGRLLVPLLVLAFLAPFVTSPERLLRLIRREPRGIVIDVTPRLGIRTGEPPSPDGDEPGDDAPGDDQPDERPPTPAS